MGRWLESYTYRIEIPWWVYGAAIFGVLFIALVTQQEHVKYCIVASKFCGLMSLFMMRVIA